MSRLFGTDGIRGVANVEPLTPELAFRVGRQLVATLGEHGTERVRVVIRVAESVDITSKGRILFGEAHFRAMSEDEAHRRSTVEETARTNLEGLPNTFVTAIDAVPGEVGWTVRAEVVGPHVPAPRDVHDVEERTAKAIAEPVDLAVRARTDVLVTGREYRVVGEAQVRDDGDAPSAPEARSP